MKNLELVKRIKEIIESETSLEKESESTYVGEIYVKRDDMYIYDKNTLAKLSEEGEEAVCQFINDCYMYSDISEDYYIREIVKSKFTSEELEKYEDDIDEFIAENISFTFPKGFVWDSEVLVNIIITGYDDYDYDFSQNNFYTDDDENDRLCDGGIKWLIEQQGYSVDEFERELNIADVPFTNRFFSSVYNEILNTTTSLNSLVISTKMTLEQVIYLKKAHKEKQFKYLKIDKNCDIGLVDFWLGAGSVLDIELEKDLEIPLENIYEISCDSLHSNNIGNIYGHTSDSYWDEVEYSVI